MKIKAKITILIGENGLDLTVINDLMTVDPDELPADGEAYLDSMRVDGPHKIAFIHPETL